MNRPEIFKECCRLLTVLKRYIYWHFTYTSRDGRKSCVLRCAHRKG